ncbi:MAG: Abi-alpha family protein [Verrucomicrobiales bacterium]|nr:Abi-alpha family protein [Verrucomicrobiales bacterium]
MIPIVKIPKQASKEIVAFLSKLAGPAATEVGLLLQDEVRLWRLKNQVRILGKAQQILNEAGLQPSAVPLRTLLPLLEGAALEDDPILIDKWACLLANAGSQSIIISAHPAFPRILSEITPEEAFFLDRLSQLGGLSVWDDFRKIIQEHLKISREQVDRDYGNLSRLGVCRIVKKNKGDKGMVEIGPFGLLFLKACSPPAL